jgi:sugar phosphate permease
LAAANTLLTAALAVWVRETPRGKIFSENANAKSEQALSVLQTLIILFRDLNYWGIALASFTWYGVWATILNLWGGPYLMVHLNLPKMTATHILFVAGIGSMIGTPLGGLLSDRVFKSRKKVALISLLVMAGALLSMAHWPGQNWLILLSALFFSFGCFGGFGAIFYTHIKEIMPEQMSGTAMTGINFFICLGAGVFLHSLGHVVGRGANESLTAGGDYYSAFMICFWALAAALFVYMFTRDAKPQ